MYQIWPFLAGVSDDSRAKPSRSHSSGGGSHEEGGEHGHRQLDAGQQPQLPYSEELLPSKPEGTALCGEWQEK